MKIESVEPMVVHNWMIVRMTTDTGLIGIGESTMFGYPQAVAAVVRTMAARLIGQDPTRPEFHFLDLYRAYSMRGMVIGGALSALDQAMWDIKGKHHEVPVFELLGGRVRDRVRAMLVLPYGTLDDVVASADAAVRDGYTALKVLLFQPEHHHMAHAARVADMVARLAAIRESVGDGVDLGVELHRNMSAGEAIAAVAEMERFRPLFVEDPIPPDSVLRLGEVAEKLRVPLAAGERNTTIWEFAEYIENAGIAYVRPDVGIAGGISHTKKICALAEAHHIGVIPHAVPSGPVATAAQVQLGFSVPNWEVQEHWEQGTSPWTDAVLNIVPVVSGHFLPPEAPGLGVELDLSGIQAIPEAPSMPPAATARDGSVAFR